MKFNISYKSDAETEESILNITGDKKFADSISKLIKSIQDIIFNMTPIFVDHIKSKKQSEKVAYINESHTITMDEKSANMIIDNNPHLINRITLIKEQDGTVIGIELK